jgi:hypothetical protein
MATCARSCCRQLFAVCGRCDRGRRYCSPECASTARREQLRRAGQQYQQSARGRSTHAMRQARYRARKTDVTHQSGSEGAGASGGPPRLVPAVLPSARIAPCPPTCVRCGKSTAFMRTSLRIRGVPRSRKHGVPFGTKSLVDHAHPRSLATPRRVHDPRFSPVNFTEYPRFLMPANSAGSPMPHRRRSAFRRAASRAWRGADWMTSARCWIRTPTRPGRRCCRCLTGRWFARPSRPPKDRGSRLKEPRSSGGFSLSNPVSVTQRPQGDSNPCYSLERAVSWAGLDDGDVSQGAGR